MHPVIETIFAIIAVAICVAIGAGAVFTRPIPIRPLTFIYGLSSGVMLAAVFFSLLEPAITAAEDSKLFPLIPVSIGFFLGCLFVHLIERSIPGDDGIWCSCFKRFKRGRGEGGLRSEEEERTRDEPIFASRTEALRKSLMITDPDMIRELNSPSSAEYHLMEGGGIDHPRSRNSSRLSTSTDPDMPALSLASSSTSSLGLSSSSSSTLPFGLSKRSLLLLIAVVSENLPEGVAIGVAFGAVDNEAVKGVASRDAAFRSALILTIGVCVSSIPEALAISLPLRAEGLTPLKSWLLATSTSLSTLLGAILGVVAVTFVSSILSYALAFAAGAMIYVVVREMLPEAMGLSSVNVATSGFIVGFMLLMCLDITFSATSSPDTATGGSLSGSTSI